jgi:hypothetical protein
MQGVSGLLVTHLDPDRGRILGNLKVLYHDL